MLEIDRQMKTLVLPPRYSPDSIALAGAAAVQGWGVERLASWNPPPWLANEEVVLYGEPLFAAIVAESLVLALLSPPPDWLTHLPEPLKLREIRFKTLGEARRLDRPTFVKPAEDKCFQARVYQSAAELPSEGVLLGTTPVLVAEPVEWTVEWRCFVREGEVVTSSPYWRNGALAQAPDGSWPAPAGEREQALEFAALVLGQKEVYLPPAVVLDVGKIMGKGWAVIEANAAWGSGIYGCAPEVVLRVVERACVRRTLLAEEDRKWVWTAEAAD
jgi:hypothetical protein